MILVAAVFGMCWGGWLLNHLRARRTTGEARDRAQALALRFWLSGVAVILGGLLIAYVVQPTGKSALTATEELRVCTHDYLARREHTIAIRADGVLRSEWIENKSWGPGDIDPRHQRVEVRQGSLSSAQRAELARALDPWRWKQFATTYPAVPDETGLEVTYLGKTVRGGHGQVPVELRQTYARLSEWATTMPPATPATTQSAAN